VIQSDIDLCNRALLALGCQAIQSLNDGTTEAQVAKLLYPAERDAQLTGFPWWFARAEADLNRLTAAPSHQYAYGYQLPTDMLSVRSVLDGRHAACGDYMLMRGALCTDAESVRLVYTCRAAEQTFPPYFQSLLVDWLTLRMVIPITESLDRFNALSQIAAESQRRARLMDSQSDTPNTIDMSALLRVRG